MPTTVFLTDDAAVMRKAVRDFLSSEADVSLVGEATNCTDAVGQIQLLKPDVVILDLHLLKFCDDTRQFRNAIQGARILAITFGKDAEGQEFADRIGADIFLDKSDLSEELVPAIRKLAEPRAPS